MPEKQNRRSETFHNISGGIASIATAIGLIVGAVWTYDVFIKERKSFVSANIVHNIEHHVLGRDILLLRINVSIENKGTRLLSLVSGQVRVESVVPLSERLEAEIDLTPDINVKGRTVIAWPAIVLRQLNWQLGEFEIEPGETDTFYNEFIIPSTYKLVNIYTYFTNNQKTPSGAEMGWSRSTLYKIHDKQ